MEKPDTQPDLTARIDEQLKATEGHTPGLWYYQHGHGIEVWRDGGCGLLIWPEVGARATGIDLDLMASAPTLRALLVEARAQLAAQAEALARVRGLADTWAREADATFGALPGDPRAGIRQAGRASELEMRAEALHVALGARS